MFVLTRFCYIKGLFHIFYHDYWGKENCLLYQGILYNYRGSLYQGFTVTMDCCLEQLKFSTMFRQIS